jgi:hypothetical protein
MRYAGDTCEVKYPADCRNRLERVNAAPELGAQRTRHKLRDAIPSVDELSSAVSRMNAAPWEDPFALALGEAAPIEEEGAWAWFVGVV